MVCLDLEAKEEKRQLNLDIYIQTLILLHDLYL